MNSKKIILFSSPEPVSGELFLLREILKTTPILLHIKKKDFVVGDYKTLLKEFPSRVFFHSSSSEVPDENRHGLNFGNSASFHSWEELNEHSHQLNYFFLSPFFDSISKQGYQARNELMNIHSIELYKDKLVALGGVHEGNLPILKSMGILHIAVLGAVWKSEDPVKACQDICRKWIS